MNTPSNHFGQPVGDLLENWTPPPVPAREKMTGRFCQLEPLEIEPHAADLFNANQEDAEGRGWTYLPYGPFAEIETYREWLENTCLGNDPLFFAIRDLRTDHVTGLASYLRITPENGSIEVGHIHYSPRLQKTVAATEAMFLMMQRAFESGYRRYEWKCHSLNKASRAAAHRLGFSFEGVFRQHAVVKGRNRDTAWYATTDSDWPALQNAFTTWLSPGNFDESGNQLTRLSTLTSPISDLSAPDEAPNRHSSNTEKSPIDWQQTPIDSFELITEDWIRNAIELIRPHVPASSTSTITSERGDQILAKFENENPTGAFKVRGGLVYFDWLKNVEPKIRSVIAATRGNHGQSVALAARKAGMHAKIVVPFGNSTSKNEAMRQLGAEVFEHGRDFAEAMDFAASEAHREGRHLVPSFDWKLVLGVATYGYELLSESPNVDAIYVPLGLGSGICGTIAARNALGLSTKIIGVVAENAPAYARSLAAGEIRISDETPDTIADGVALRIPNEASFSVIKQYVDEIVTVPEANICKAIRSLHELTGNRIEGAGAIGYAAWMQEEPGRFRNPAVIISGGNIDDSVFHKIV